MEQFEPMELRIVRVRKGWTIRSLAKTLGYSPVWLSLCENSKGSPSKRLLVAWRQALGLTMTA